MYRIEKQKRSKPASIQLEKAHVVNVPKSSSENGTPGSRLAIRQQCRSKLEFDSFDTSSEGFAGPIACSSSQSNRDEEEKKMKCLPRAESSQRLVNGTGRFFPFSILFAFNFQIRISTKPTCSVGLSGSKTPRAKQTGKEREDLGQKSANYIGPEAPEDLRRSLTFGSTKGLHGLDSHSGVCLAVVYVHECRSSDVTVRARKTALCHQLATGIVATPDGVSTRLP